MPHRPTALYFSHVIAIAPERAIVCGFLQAEGTEPSVTRVMMIAEGRWYHLYDLPDVVHDARRLPANATRKVDVYAFLGRLGLLREHPSGAAFQDDAIDLPHAYAHALHDIDGTLYACGTQRQVWRREPQGWTRLDTGLYEPLGDRVTSQLRALAGAAHDDVYAVGDGGELWHWDGRRWSRQPCPTSAALHAVMVATNGALLVAGAAGTLLRRDAQGAWTDLSEGAFPHQPFTHMAPFAGAVYLAGGKALMRLDAQGLSAVAVPRPGPLPVHHLDANASALWCVGDDGVLSFDGHRWQQHACPEN